MGSTTRDSRCNTMTNFIISLCLISIFFGISSGFSKEATLKQSLLEYYDPTTKPEGQTTVEISVRPVNMKMCPKSQVLTLHTWNMYKWKDLRLTWNPEYFDNITTLLLRLFRFCGGDRLHNLSR